MKEAYESKDTEVFLVCELQPADQLDGNSLRALAGGKLQGFAAASFSQVGNTKYIRYDVSGKTPFFRLMKEPVTKQVLLGALGGIADALISVEANQVDPATVILNPAHVFVNAATGETVMICMPLVNFRPGQSVNMLYDFILSNARLDKAENQSVVAYLKNYLRGNPNPAPAAMKAELTKAATPAEDVAAPAAPVKPAEPFVVPPVQAAPPQPMQQPQPDTSKPMSMFRLLEHHKAEEAAKAEAARAAETARAEEAAKAAEVKKNAVRQFDFAIPGMPEKPAAAEIPKKPADPADTTVVDAGQMSTAHAYLLRAKNGERAPITKPFFRIGKEKSYVDYCISDNSAISRAHAYIVNKDGQYFLADTHSTNHTYINGGMIPPDVETRLFHGAKVRFANEEFEFKLH